MTENSLGKECFHGQMLPLATGLEFIKDGVDYLYQATFCLTSAFCSRETWQYFRFYCNFVEYSVHRFFFMNGLNHP